MSADLQKIISNKGVLYFAMAIGLYFFALFLGTIAKLIFGIEFVSYKGVQVDIVTYLIFGTFDVFFQILQGLGIAILVIIVWIYNTFIIRLLINTILGAIIPVFREAGGISETVLYQIANILESFRIMFTDFAWYFFSTASETVGDIVEPIAEPFIPEEGGTVW